MKMKAFLFAASSVIWALLVLGFPFCHGASASSVTEPMRLSRVVLAQASAQTTPKPTKKAVMSFSGSGNKSVKVVDHRTNTEETRATSSFSINQLKEIRVEASPQPTATTEEQSAPEGSEEIVDPEGAGEDESKPEISQAEEKAAHQADLRDGVKTLQGEGLIVYGDGDAIPETIYNPYTKQYIPVEQAVKELRERKGQGQRARVNNKGQEQGPRARAKSGGQAQGPRTRAKSEGQAQGPSARAKSEGHQQGQRARAKGEGNGQKQRARAKHEANEQGESARP